MEDKKIISLLWQRAEAGLDALARKFGTRLLATARNILGSHEDAEESVSDTYLAVWNAIPPKQPDPLGGFVFKTGRNLALKRLRHNTAGKRDGTYDLSLDELAACIPGPALEDTVDARDLGLAIDRFLSTISRENRSIFLLRYWFGDSPGQIGKRLGLTSGAVSARLNRTRSQLRDYLIQEGYYE